MTIPLKDKTTKTVTFVDRDKEPWRKFAARMAIARAKKEKERQIEEILDML